MIFIYECHFLIWIIALVTHIRFFTIENHRKYRLGVTHVNMNYYLWIEIYASYVIFIFIILPNVMIRIFQMFSWEVRIFSIIHTFAMNKLTMDLHMVFCSTVNIFNPFMPELSSDAISNYFISKMD